MRAAAALTLLVACGAPPAGQCPNDLPSGCVAPGPRWSADVSPVFGRTCAPCHGPGGVEAARPLVAWTDISARRTSVLTQVFACKMPLADAGVELTPSERQVVLQWLVCGAADN